MRVSIGQLLPTGNSIWIATKMAGDSAGDLNEFTRREDSSQMMAMTVTVKETWSIKQF